MMIIIYHSPWVVTNILTQCGARTFRSLLGLPGGRKHPMFGQVEAAATNRGLTLVDGKGNDPDTLGKRLVYVMDSNKFPFYQAEVCEYFLLAACFEFESKRTQQI